MSDDTAKETDPLPSGPEAGEAPPPQDASGDEVEYVYEDEQGNRIEAPESGFDSGEYEEVVTEVPADDAGESVPAGASAPDGGAEAESAASSPAAAATATMPTQKILKPTSSSRKAGDRKSGRQPKSMTPEELKKVRRKVILLLGLIALIPILSITLLVLLRYKGRLGGAKPMRQKMVDNDFDRGRSLYVQTSPYLERANRLYDQGKRAEAYEEYKKCKQDFEEALKMIDKWRQDNPGDYAQVDMTAQEIRVKLHRHVNERLAIIEASGQTSAPPPK